MNNRENKMGSGVEFEVLENGWMDGFCGNFAMRKLENFEKGLLDCGYWWWWWWW